MPHIGIITGVKTEEAALSSVMNSVDAPYVRLSGARPARARGGVEALLSMGVDGLLSFGSAGAVAPEIEPGQILVGGDVVDIDGVSRATDRAWTDRMTSALGVAPSSFAGLDFVADENDKAAFHENGVAAVDMESHIVAQMADEAGLPFAVLRAVVDPQGFTIPDYALDSVRPDGSISLLPIVAGLCTQPWTIGRLLDLSRYNKSAMESLSSAARVLGPGLGFFTL